jgi:mono/diheme cytochrome c family protein
MMMQPRLACVSCHGADGRGGTHVMHMQVMDAPDIRFATLNSEEGEHGGGEAGIEHTQGDYDLDMFQQAVVEGKHPDGDALSKDMPRWEISDGDLAALFEYLKTLP